MAEEGQERVGVTTTRCRKANGLLPIYELLIASRIVSPDAGPTDANARSHIASMRDANAHFDRVGCAIPCWRV
jgi:hypothetical protein